jgi:UDP-N-acetylglucosamine 2-epimerase (non-hydrolysing)
MTLKMKVMMVFGTRPETIKMAPLYHALKALPDSFDVLVCVTAQHREMLDQTLKDFEINPDVDLNLMKTGQDLFDVTSSVLLGMRNVIQKYKPDLLLVHGDTSTALATAIAGFYLGVSVGHIEAGLRTYNLTAPFPEEFNRQIVSKVTKWHFAPTALGKANLLKEGIKENSIFVTGNTVIDALFWTLKKIDDNKDQASLLKNTLNKHLNFNWEKDKFILITGHRRENFGDSFLQICNALKELSIRYPYVHFVYPVHLNPNVQEPVNRILKGISNIHLTPPLDYKPFVFLLKHCYIVLTDSGGIQEEAPSLGKPVLVMRDVTERPEGVSAGTVTLVGANQKQIVSYVSKLLDDSVSYLSMIRSHNPYGDGKACEKIISILRGLNGQ